VAAPVNAIEVENLVKCYDRFTAVDDISFSAAAGQVTALLGPNGAGKTTTIEILEGFAVPTAGTVRVLGTDPKAGGAAGRAWRARIGLVLQSTSLDGQLTVTEALTLFGALYADPRRVAEVLDVIEMATDARTRIGVLSGGERRRVDLGIAIIGQPRMLFLDEPTTGLDPEARRRLWSVIENLVAGGTTVLLTTHYLDEAQHLASRVIVLDGGKVVADATPEALRAMGGLPVIRYRLPATAPGLPARLAGHVDRGELTLPSADVTADLSMLAGWARQHQVDLIGLEVGSPSLEDAYLALTSEKASKKEGALSHA
jgi:ABC-2 type transport system ATP-binding protein